MADITPRTTFHCALQEDEYKLVMLALAHMTDPKAVKASIRQREAASALNKQLLQLEQYAWEQRLEANARKQEMAPQATAEGDE